MSGGTVIVSSTGQADGALDYNGSFALTGGTLLAAGSGRMSQSPSEASQYAVCIGFDGTLPAGTYVSLAGEGQSHVFELPVDSSSFVFSSPELKGGTYAVSYGGVYSGQSVDGICAGGDYSGGTDLTELTLDDYITTRHGQYGRQTRRQYGQCPVGRQGRAPRRRP